MTLQERWENHYAETAYGVLHGNEKNGLHQFLGVPYAAPPVGALRFRKPVPPAKWVGIREATQYSACALQPSAMFADAYAGEDFNGRQGAEDCLYLNIWSPAKSPDEKLPVLVWVHGGGMMFGTAMSPFTDGDYIASHGAVVVTINYRLGFFGFFCHPELSAESEDGTCGNYSLYDIRQATLWVKENIAAFGGDPDNIAIGGQSGGAAAANCMLISPLMKGINQKIIIESGTCFHGMMQPPIREEAEKAGAEFMAAAGISSVEEMRKLDAVDLMRLAMQHHYMPNYIVDGAFIPRKPQEMENDGDFNDVSVIVGATAQEFAAHLTEETVSPEHFEEYVRKTYGEKADAILAAYPHATGAEAGHSYYSLIGDLHFVGVTRTAEQCAKYGRPVYAYYYTRPVLGEDGELVGALHSGELPYLFGWIDHGGKGLWAPMPWSPAEHDFAHQINRLWNEFMRSGSKGHQASSAAAAGTEDGGSADTLDGIWTPFTEAGDILELGKDVKMLDKNSDFAARLALCYSILAPRTYGIAGDYIDYSLPVM